LIEELGMGGQSSGQNGKSNKAGEACDEKGNIEMWIS
jgi:hypothetical protein